VLAVGRYRLPRCLVAHANEARPDVPKDGFGGPGGG